MAHPGTCVVSMAALCIALGASTASADVTADQVWADWRGYMSDVGYAISSTDTRSSDTLTVSGATLTLNVPEDGGTVTMTVGEMAFVDNGDGTVSIDIPSDFPIDVSVDGAEGEDVDIGLNYATRGLTITVSGDPGDMTYTYSAAGLALTLESLVVEGKEMDMAELGTARIEVADIAGSTSMAVGDLRRSTQKITTGAISYLVDINEPEGGEGHFVLQGRNDGMDLRGTVSLPEDMDPTDMAAMMAAGFAFDGSFSFQNGASDFNFRDAEQTVQAASQSGAGSLRMAMDRDRLHYALDTSDLSMSMAGGDLPFPVDIVMARAAFDVTMPVTSGETAQPFAFGLTLGDFTMSDMIWGIFDPAGQLPRDPATVALDLAGSVRLLADILDPAQMAAFESGESAPGEIEALDLKGITLRVAGAELTGSGAFTFDNSDLTTFEGMPAPTGAIDLRLEGGNGLLDKLVGMGLVPEEDATGMRMMMGLFAVPGGGEDELTSKIEVKGSGEILANGQRIK